MKKIIDICYSEESKQYLDVYLPACEAFPVFLYFHGGGLEKGDKYENGRLDPFFEYMTSHGIAVVSANYRLYPEAKYPDFLNDAAQAVAWVFENRKTYGNISKIYVGGSSAGGYISQMLCFDKRWLAKYHLSPLDISGFVHDAGQPTCHFNVLKERGIDTKRVIIDESAPLYHVGTENEYPSMQILVSDNDLQNRYEQTMLLLSTLKHFGHTEKIKFRVMNGKHNAYVKAVDQNGESVFGPIISQYILEKEKSFS